MRPSELATLDPAKNNNAGSNDGPAMFSIFDYLVYIENGVVKPQTAESLTSSDAQIWVLKLRPNIRFTDGTPYDATAVKFNWARIQDPANASPRSSVAAQIASMDVVDNTSLRITLKAKNSAFPGAVAFIPFVGSPTAIQKMGAAAFSSAPVGAGPFVFKSWVRDSQLLVDRNPAYWNAPLPFVDHIAFKPITDDTQRMNTFCAGQANMTYTPDSSAASFGKQNNCGTFLPFSLNGGPVMNFNTQKPPFDDARLRQAVAMAIDVTDYAKVVTHDFLPATRSVFTPDSPFYDPTVLQRPFDRSQAQTLIDQVAAEKYNNGTINIQMSTFSSTEYVNAGLYLQSVLNKMNHLKVEVTNEGSAAHITTCTTLAYTGICLYVVPIVDPDPGWVATQLCNAPGSLSGYCNPKFDAAVAASRTTLDPKQRIAALVDAQRIFYADVPGYYVQPRYQWMFANPAIQDIKFVNDGNPLWDRLWIKSS